MKIKILCLTALLFAQPASAQQPPQTDVTTPLHALRPDYPVPYGIPQPEEVARLLRPGGEDAGRLGRATPPGRREIRDPAAGKRRCVRVK